MTFYVILTLVFLLFIITYLAWLGYLEEDRETEIFKTLVLHNAKDPDKLTKDEPKETHSPSKKSSQNKRSSQSQARGRTVQRKKH